MKISTARVAWVLALGVASVCGQTILHSGPFAFSGTTSKNVVRAASGTLYAVSIAGTGTSNPVILQSSIDGGQTWATDPFVFNDATSGLSGLSTTLTNTCTVAIDDQDTLHVTWAAIYYPSYYAQYYRNYNPLTSIASAILNVATVTGATTGTATFATDIIVDQSNVVWMAAKGTSAWTERLIHSTNPYAAGNLFTDVGPISPTASAQVSRLAIDAAGNVHCTFYRNVGAGNYEHRVYTPGIGWGTSIVIGNTTPTNDYYGNIAADALGNVHAIIAKDTYTTSTWQFRYRRWDATFGWGPEVTLFDATPAQYTGIANYYIFALGCEESTGLVSVVYRDLTSGGALRVVQKGLTDVAFTAPADITTPAATAHAYYMPTIRGTLFPVTNRTGFDLDLTWQARPAGTPTPPFEFWFRRLTGGSPASITLGTPAAIGTTAQVNLSSPLDPTSVYICGFSFGNSPGILLPDFRVIPLNLDDLLTLSLTVGNPIFLNTIGALSASGTASAQIVIPPYPPIIGATIYAAFVVPNPSTTSGIGTISPSLAITFQ